MEGNKITSVDILGPFHLSVALIAVVILIAIAIISVTRRIKGRSVSGHWRLAFMLGIAVYFWGQMWADRNHSNMHSVIALTNIGYEPGRTAIALSKVYGISGIFSGLAFLYVILAIGIAVMGRLGKGETSVEQSPSTHNQND